MKQDVSRMCRIGIKYFSSGFSLIETAIGLGILATVSLGSATLMVDAARAKKNAETNAELIAVTRNINYSLAAYSRNQTSGGTATNPVQLYVPPSTTPCFNESAALSPEGVSMRVNLNGQNLFPTAELISGGVKLQVEELTFASAQKVYSSSDKTTYVGILYMTTKNLATNVVGPRNAISQLVIDVPTVAGSSTCTTISDVSSMTTVANDQAACNALSLHGYTNETGTSYSSTNSRCSNNTVDLKKTSPYTGPTDCTSQGGLPVFWNENITNTDTQTITSRTYVTCVSPMQSVCKQAQIASPIADTSTTNPRRVLAGFSFVNSQPPGSSGDEVAQINCQTAPIKPMVYTYPTTTPTSPTPTAPPTTSSPTLTRKKCLALESAGRIKPELFHCDNLPSSTISKVPSTLSPLAAPPSSSSVTQSSSGSCICGSGTISNLAHCGYYYSGAQGQNESTVASAVYQCQDGILQLVTGFVAPPPTGISDVSQTTSRNGTMQPLTATTSASGTVVYTLSN